jgi:hypothetical protein
MNVFVCSAEPESGRRILDAVAATGAEGRLWDAWRAMLDRAREGGCDAMIVEVAALGPAGGYRAFVEAKRSDPGLYPIPLVLVGTVPAGPGPEQSPLPPLLIARLSDQAPPEEIAHALRAARESPRGLA